MAAVTYTLASRGRELGHTGAELPGLAPGARGWHFLPEAAFEPHRAMLLELQQVTMGLEELMPTPDTLASIREEEREDFVRNAMLSDPRAPRFLELMDAVEALGLELRDPAGTVLPTRTLGVTELELDARQVRELLASLDPAAAGAAAAAVPPFYLLVAGV